MEMKIHLRTLWGNDERALWDNEAQREGLQKHLNDYGFYVLTGAGDSLEVYAVNYDDPLDVRLAKKALDKIGKLWYACIRRKEVTP